MLLNMPKFHILSLLLVLVALATVVSAHGSHADEETNENDDWATRHMKEEHHISGFDPGSFFALHDYDNSGVWTEEDVRRTYGFDDESTDEVPEERKQQAIDQVFSIFDPEGTGEISRDEFMRLSREGYKLPDFGLGPGHHGDLEYEYEIHHFEKYHGDDAKEEDLTHPEDIEHFRRHEHEERAQTRLEMLERMSIVEGNIPAKFLRNAA